MKTLAALMTTSKALTNKAALLAKLATRVAAIPKDVEQHVAKLAQDYEPFALAGAEHKQQVARDIRRTWTQAREVTAGSELFSVTVMAETLGRDLETFIAAQQVNIAASFPETVFDHFGPGDMMQAAIYRELRRSTIEAMTAGDLLSAYERGLESGDAPSYIDVELIEARLARRDGIAKTEADIPAVKALAARVAEEQASRVPAEVESVTAALDQARKAIGRASILNIVPVNLDHGPAETRQIVERELAEAAA